MILGRTGRSNRRGPRDTPAMMAAPVDCLIIGGGPAGLTAAIYLARFHLSTVLLDDGHSRALQIPCTNNHAGFPDGISGRELVGRMQAQALRFGARILSGRVDDVMIAAEGFRALGSDIALEARSMLIATGVTNRRPIIDDATHAEALARGKLRYCPVCDGFEVTDQNVAVIGSGPRAISECEFLRSYTARVSLILDRRDNLTEIDVRRLADIGVPVIAGPPRDFGLEPDGLSFSVSKKRLRFEAVYPALGSIIHSKLATSLGAAVTDEGCIQVDPHQRTTRSGLYAAGDVVKGLDQISHAMGEAGVAATTIRNDLASVRPRLR